MFTKKEAAVFLALIVLLMMTISTLIGIVSYYFGASQDWSIGIGIGSLILICYKFLPRDPMQYS